MDAFRLTTSVHDGVVTVAVAGELDIATRDRLRAHLFELLDRAAQPGEIVLELGGLTFIDAAGLGALVAVHQRARQRRARLMLARVPPMTARLMRITGLDAGFGTRARGS